MHCLSNTCKAKGPILKIKATLSKTGNLTWEVGYTGDRRMRSQRGWWGVPDAKTKVPKQEFMTNTQQWGQKEEVVTGSPVQGAATMACLLRNSRSDRGDMTITGGYLMPRWKKYLVLFTNLIPFSFPSISPNSSRSTWYRRLGYTRGQPSLALGAEWGRERKQWVWGLGRARASMVPSLCYLAPFLLILLWHTRVTVR